MVDPVSGDTTTYQFPGNPVAGSGWLDPNPDDKRIILSAGPFTMEPGDTQHIAIAVVVGRGSDRLESVEVMKSHDRIAQISYDNGFKWPTWPHTDGKMPEGTPAVTAAGVDIAEMGEGLRLTASPNPSRAEVSVTYSTAVAGPVRLKVYDTSGRLVRALVDQCVPGGVSRFTWDGRNARGDRVPAGVYFIACESGYSSARSKVVLMR